MKKSLFGVCLTLCSVFSLRAQCVFSCYNYTLVPITFSTFPNTGNDCVSQFLPTIDDGITLPVPIGFNFDYYCATYSTVLVCSNGFLQFDINSPPNLSFANPAQTFPDPTSPNGIVALNMNDFDPNMGGTITYTTIGVSPNRKFVLTYSNVPIWSVNSSLNSGQIVLCETSNFIEIHTDNVNASNTNIYAGTQGIENPTGSMGSAVAGRNNSLWVATTPSAYRWVPIPTYSATPPTAVTGTQSSCEGITHIYTVTSMPGATSYSWALPPFWSGNSGTTSINATPGASGQISVTATYSCGTSSPITISVNVFPSPFVSITSVTPVIFCSGPSVTITTSGAATYTLQPGNLSGISPFITTPASSTTFSVSGTSSLGCISNNIGTYQITVKETPTVTVNSGSICLGQTFTMTPSGAGTYVFSSFWPEVTPVTPGTYSYTVIGTGTNGCVGATASSTLIVHPLPVVTAVSTRTSICSKESATLTANGATNYSWSATSTNSTIVVKPTTLTTYTVIGMDVNGCSKTASININVSGCVGLSETALSEFSLLVYPNPSQGEYRVTSDAAVSIEVFDILGEKVFSSSFQQGSHPIDLNHLASGKYFLVASDGSNRKHLLLIKE